MVAGNPLLASFFCSSRAGRGGTQDRKDSDERAPALRFVYVDESGVADKLRQAALDVVGRLESVEQLHWQERDSDEEVARLGPVCSGSEAPGRTLPLFTGPSTGPPTVPSTVTNPEEN